MTQAIQNSNTPDGAKGVNRANAGFLSRFLPTVELPKSAIPTPETLDPTERRRLMEDCLAQCRLRKTRQNIDWREVDRINGLIGSATTKAELVPLLGQYKAALVEVSA